MFQNNYRLQKHEIESKLRTVQRLRFNNKITLQYSYHTCYTNGTIESIIYTIKNNDPELNNIFKGLDVNDLYCTISPKIGIYKSILYDDQIQALWYIINNHNSIIVFTLPMKPQDLVDAQKQLNN